MLPVLASAPHPVPQPSNVLQQLRFVFDDERLLIGIVMARDLEADVARGPVFNPLRRSRNAKLRHKPLSFLGAIGVRTSWLSDDATPGVDAPVVASSFRRGQFSGISVTQMTAPEGCLYCRGLGSRCLIDPLQHAVLVVEGLVGQVLATQVIATGSPLGSVRGCRRASTSA